MRHKLDGHADAIDDRERGPDVAVDHGVRGERAQLGVRLAQEARPVPGEDLRLGRVGRGDEPGDVVQGRDVGQEPSVRLVAGRKRFLQLVQVVNAQAGPGDVADQQAGVVGAPFYVRDCTPLTTCPLLPRCYHPWCRR
jgi:hypothetical protein